eukprot:CCRYP_007950-RA/>CCRYP_007950-RA protein AED:0.00 eAED:0.00 QI:24/1/1/1/0/0/2/260/81
MSFSIAIDSVSLICLAFFKASSRSINDPARSFFNRLADDKRHSRVTIHFCFVCELGPSNDARTGYSECLLRESNCSASIES